MNDVFDWTNTKNYGTLIRAAENRENWRKLISLSLSSHFKRRQSSDVVLVILPVITAAMGKIWPKISIFRGNAVLSCGFTAGTGAPASVFAAVTMSVLSFIKSMMIILMTLCRYYADYLVNQLFIC